MTDAPGVDIEALGRYLTSELGEALTGTEVLSDGLNLVVAVGTTAGRYVLRRPQKLREADYMLDLRAEYEVMRRLARTVVPTPEPAVFCADESILGDRFFLMTRLEGATVPLGSDLPERFRTASGRERLAHGLIDTLGAAHEVDIDPLEAFCDRVTPHEQVDRSVARLDMARSVTGRELPELRAVADWLRERAPPESTTRFLHGDFRPGNVLFAGLRASGPSVTGVLDWETALLGDPRTELGYLLLRWRDDGDPRPGLADIKDRYPDHEALDHLRAVGDSGLAPFTNDPGSPTRGELVARYEAATGVEYGHDRFYRVHAAFLLAVVLEDLHRHRIEAGEPSDWEPHVDYMTALGACIVGEDLRA